MSPKKTAVEEDEQDVSATDSPGTPLVRIEGAQTNEPQAMPWSPPKSDSETPPSDVDDE